MASKLSGIELTRYDDLFKTDAEREADRQERIQLVPAAEVFPYSRQPYTIDRPTPDLVRLMDSIEHIGIAEPLIVRPRESGGYEIISGHRRDYCAKAVGLDMFVLACTMRQRTGDERFYPPARQAAGRFAALQKQMGGHTDVFAVDNHSCVINAAMEQLAKPERSKEKPVAQRKQSEPER